MQNGGGGVLGTVGSSRVLIKGRLGRGGHGEVLLAEIRDDENHFVKLVAIKCVVASGSTLSLEAEKRLRDECRILGRMNHANIVQVWGIIQLDGRPAILMEFVPGVDLRSMVRALGPMPLGPALQCTVEVGEALRYAHEIGPPPVLHRDVKLANIRLTPAGQVKLVDFGIARAVFPGREGDTAMRFGTFGYMAPERHEGADQPASDVYALGVVLFELLAGSPMGKTHSERQRALSRFRHQGLPRGVVALLTSCLTQDPAARPTAKQVRKRATRLWKQHGELDLAEWVDQVSEHIPAEPELEEEGTEATVGVHTPLSFDRTIDGGSTEMSRHTGFGRMAAAMALVLLALLSYASYLGAAPWRGGGGAADALVPSAEGPEETSEAIVAKEEAPALVPKPAPRSKPPGTAVSPRPIAPEDPRPVPAPRRMVRVTVGDDGPVRWLAGADGPPKRWDTSSTNQVEAGAYLVAPAMDDPDVTWGCFAFDDPGAHYKLNCDWNVKRCVQTEPRYAKPALTCARLTERGDP